MEDLKAKEGVLTLKRPESQSENKQARNLCSFTLSIRERLHV